MERVEQEHNWEIGEKIQNYRRERNLTQQDLAYEIGLDAKSLSKIENGNIGCSREKLILIMKTLKITPNQLFPQCLSKGYLGGEYDELQNELANLPAEDRSRYIRAFRDLLAIGKHR